jgi:DNA-binding transcriptional ArsR family regulator
MQSEHLIDSIQTLKIYSDPLRQRILRALAEKPRSVNEIAQILNVPFTRLYYHMHLLERHKLIVLADVRLISGAVEEKRYQVMARTFVIDRRLLTFFNDEATTASEQALEPSLSQLDRAQQGLRANARRGCPLNTADMDSMLLLGRAIQLTPEQAQGLRNDLLKLMDAQPQGETPSHYLTITLHSTDAS